MAGSGRWQGMSNDKHQMLRPDGRRYEAPGPSERRLNKDVGYAVLGLLVIVLAILIATGVVPIHPGS
jgi:hypothetical protein